MKSMDTTTTTTSCTKIRSIDVIGEDLLQNVLSRLPALSFASAACVSRFWNLLCDSILSTPKLSSALSQNPSLKVSHYIYIYIYICMYVFVYVMPYAPLFLFYVFMYDSKHRSIWKQKISNLIISIFIGCCRRSFSQGFCWTNSPAFRHCLSWSFLLPAQGSPTRMDDDGFCVYSLYNQFLD